jgi:hypothetical protein
MFNFSLQRLLVVKPGRSQRKFNWLDNYSQDSTASSVRKIRQAVRVFFHAYGRTERLNTRSAGLRTCFKQISFGPGICFTTE